MSHSGTQWNISSHMETKKGSMKIVDMGHRKTNERLILSIYVSAKLPLIKEKNERTKQSPSPNYPFLLKNQGAEGKERHFSGPLLTDISNSSYNAHAKYSQSRYFTF